MRNIKFQFKIQNFCFLAAIFSLLFFTFSFGIAQAAQIYLLPQEAEVGVGDTILSELRIDTEGENVNAFDIKLFYPFDVLEIAEVIKGGSLINLWISEPSYSNDEGVLEVQGGRIGGLSGDGILLKILFRGKSISSGLVTFHPTSKVLLHDGQGTPAQSSYSPAYYIVKERIADSLELTSRTHPTEDMWYQANKINIMWKTQNSLLYSHILSRDAVQVPDNQPDEEAGAVEYNKPSDGIYYFSVKESSDNGESWSSISTYRLLQDKTPPESFEIILGRDDSIYGGKHFITFASSDRTSGIDHYEIHEGTLMQTLIGAKWKVIKGSYPLSDQKLNSIIKVKAVDEAGNYRVETFKPKIILISEIILYAILLIIVAVMSILFFAKKEFKIKF